MKHLKLFLLTTLYVAFDCSLLALSYYSNPNLYRNGAVSPILDHMAQEQRLALQIITTDPDAANNLTPTTSSTLEEGELPRNDARSLSFDSQYDLLSSQLAKVANQNKTTATKQAVAPKRIVINLNSLGANASDEERGVTRLTIGFAPQDQQANGDGGSMKKSEKSDSERSKAYVSLDGSPRRDTASTERSSGGSGIRPATPGSAMRSSLMEGVWRQGGIPAMVMRNREEMGSERKPRLKFMLNSDMIDRHLQREQPQNEGLRQQQSMRSMQPSETAVESTADNTVGLHEELENVSGEIDSLNGRLGGRAERRPQVNRHEDSYNNRYADAGNLLTRQRNSRSYLEPKQVRGDYERLSDDTYGSATMTVSSSPNGRGNEIRADRPAYPKFSRENHNNYDYALHKSPPLSRNYLGGDERNRRFVHAADNSASSLTKSLSLPRQNDFHPPSRVQVNVVREGAQRPRHSYNYESSNRIYESEKLEELPSSPVDSMNNFEDAHRWRQRDSRDPLLADNGSYGPLDEQQQQGRAREQHRHATSAPDDNVGKSNDISASVVTGTDALNSEQSRQQQDDDNFPRKRERSSPAFKQMEGSGDQLKLDERVAQLLDRLKLYTTRDQLMKVARDLQGYPSKEEATRNFKLDQEEISDLSSRKELPVNSTMSAKESMKASQSREPNYRYHDTTIGDGQSESDTTTAGGLNNYEPSSSMSSEARNMIPSPVEYHSEDSFVTSATAGREYNKPNNLDNLMQTATDQVEDLHSGSKADVKQSASDASKLLDDFRRRQMRLKSIQTGTDSGHDTENDSGSSVSDGVSHRATLNNILEDTEEIENVPQNNGSQQVAEESGSNDVYDGTALATENSANNPEDANEYSTSKDLLELFKNNARLFDTDNEDGFARRSGELLPPPKKNSTLGSEGKEEISIDVAGRDRVNNDGDDESFTTSDSGTKSNAKEEQEVRALEQIIDELVAREKKEKKEAKKGKKN